MANEYFKAENLDNRADFPLLLLMNERIICYENDV